MAISYTEAKATLDDIAERSESNRKRLVSAINQIAAAQGDLAAMPGAYSSVIAEIDAQASANPTDPAWENVKAAKDLMVTDFQAVKANADALKTAVDAV